MSATNDRTRRDVDVTDRIAAWQAAQAAQVRLADDQRDTLEGFQLAFAAVILDALEGAIDEDECSRRGAALTTEFFVTAHQLGMQRMYSAIVALQARAQAGELARVEEAGTDDPAFLAWAREHGPHYTRAWLLGYGCAISQHHPGPPAV